MTSKCKILTANFYLFLMFSVVLFVKTLCFHWFTVHGLLLSSLFHNPCEFFRFWGGKIAPILFLGSFVFLLKNKWWTIVVNVFLDIWIISNLLYFKANGFFLSYESIKLIDNMGGFWDSIYTYLGWDIFISPILTLVYFSTIKFIKVKNRHTIVFALLLLCSILVSIIDTVLYRIYTLTWDGGNDVAKEINATMLSSEEYKYYFPFAHVYYYAAIETCMEYNMWSYLYVKEQSIISYFPASFIYHFISPPGEIKLLSEEQRCEIMSHIQDNGELTRPKNNIVLILFESFESWALDDVCGYNYMPCLNKLIKSSGVLYCNKLKSQTRHANSADGQMIDVTGLLPISDGATCRLYGTNKNPSYAELFNNSIIINPAPGMWNQSIVTYNYQFKELYEPKKNEPYGDEELLLGMYNYIDSVAEPFCLLGITVSSHVPFSRGASHVKHRIDGMPEMMSAYLNCLSYTDSCIGAFIEKVKECDKYKNTTIVISGDHTIFRSKNEEMDNFAAENGVKMQTTHTYTPLIIYSPLINGNIRVDDTCYQMDIYPTIINLIGCENYFWKGLGVNLFDTIAIRNRKISEQEAYHLSDLIIRSNFFNTYKRSYGNEL